MKPRKEKSLHEIDHKVIFLAIHKDETEDTNQPMSKMELYEADLIQPRLPIVRPENEFKGKCYTFSWNFTAALFFTFQVFFLFLKR